MLAVSRYLVKPRLRRVWSPLLMCPAGLYYKLHGVHRPVTMKKAVIKRRKRVLPVTQGSHPPADERSSSGEPSASPPPASESSVERGTSNADGSVNLGLRRRPEPPLALVPETVLRQNRQ